MSLITWHHLAATRGWAELMSVRDSQQMDGGSKALLGVCNECLLVIRLKKKKKSSCVSLLESNEKKRLSGT